MFIFKLYRYTLPLHLSSNSLTNVIFFPFLSTFLIFLYSSPHYCLAHLPPLSLLCLTISSFLFPFLILSLISSYSRSFNSHPLPLLLFSVFFLHSHLPLLSFRLYLFFSPLFLFNSPFLNIFSLFYF